MENDVQLLKRKRDKLRKIQTLKEGLPHLYSFPMYQWQEDFWNCPATFQFIFKANQIGGSSVMIKRMIHYCTEPKLWDRFTKKPKITMYLYPDKKSATREWEGKWSEFMPKNEYKDHEQYGWKETWDGNYIDTVEFNSGVTLYFKTYGSGAENLQASTPAILACDEELPEELWPELQMRIASPANKGAMYWLGCTPTLGQKYLAKIQSGETKIPDSWVKTVSMYDCLKYSNGDRSIWTLDKIKQIEQTLPNDKEIQVRVHGLFKATDGLLISQFNSSKHVKPYHAIKGWETYVGIDYGVGGSTGHPSAIVFVTISPSYNAARVIKAWRGPYGPNSESTTPDDVILRYIEMCNELGLDQPTGVYYDPAAASIGVLAERQGLGFQKANKDREHGFNLLNSLFKNDMLILLDDGKGAIQELATELESVTSEFNKKRAGDDLMDALRYCISLIPFNFENLKIQIQTEVKTTKTIGRHEVEETYDFDDVSEEVDEWNEYY
jgi:hypothetical protein